MTKAINLIPDSDVRKSKDKFGYLRKLKEDKKFRERHEVKKVRKLLHSDFRVIITNRSGFKIRVSLIKAFLIGTEYNIEITTNGEVRTYKASYFNFDVLRFYRKMMKDDDLFDEVFRLYYILVDNAGYYLAKSRLLRFLKRLEKIKLSHLKKKQRRKKS